MTHMNDGAPHIPVMLNEVLQTLAPKAGEVYVDGTFGAGGYSRAILDSADCTVIGIDRDESAIEMASGWKDKYGERLKIVHSNFANAKSCLQDIGIDKVDAVILDLGVSSMQIDRQERGFSFRFDGPLDMRMDRSSGETAADLVNTLSEEDLANIIYQYGEEKASRRVAAAIIKARAEKKIETTSELANIVRSVVHVSPKVRIDPATRTFQALRLKVNDELGKVEALLDSTLDILKDGGRLVVVTFHSLEDRIVKNFLIKHGKQAAAPSRYLPATASSEKPAFSILTKKALIPTDSEISQNPRSRSAKLRAAQRIYTGVAA